MRPPRVFSLLVLVVVLAVTASTARAESATELLQRTLAKMGDPAQLARFGTFQIMAEGTLNKTAEGQGHHPDEPSSGPYRETFAVDVLGNRIARHYLEERFDGTFESFREAYLGDEERLYVVAEPPLVIPFRGEGLIRERPRLERRLPHLAVSELLARSPQLRRDAGSPSIVHGALADGTLLTVEVADDLVRALSYRKNLTAKGHTEVRWWFDDYRLVEGLGWFPFRYGSTVGGRAHVDMTVRSVGPGGEELFLAPEDHHRIPEQPVDDEEPATPPALTLEPVYSDVYRVPEVRGGFAPLVVAFDEFTVVVDAPASFPMLGKVPAEETDPAPHFSWHCERLVDAITESLPDRPIRYLVLTHAHEDHVGGVRAFVAAGATVLASPVVRPVLESICTLPALEIDDRLASSPEATLRFEAVREPHVLSDSSRRLVLLPMGENPHAEGMLVVHLPRERTLFVSDLVTPERLEVYPRHAHAALDRFFGAWLADSSLEIDTVVSMHGAAKATEAHLELIQP